MMEKEKIYEEDDILEGENQNIPVIEEDNFDFEDKRKQLRSLKILKHTWSLSEIYQKIRAGVIKLDPKYQRKEVWNKETQSQFIESLFIGIVIPPIYLAEIRPKKVLDSITYEVVDGKQRLTSIKNFFESKLKLTGNLQYYSDLFIGKNFDYIEEEFPEEVEKMLSSVIDLYVISQNADPEIKYDVFARLNRGNIKLTQAELRNAIYSSDITDIIRTEVVEIEGREEYKDAFSSSEKKRFKNINRAFQSLAYIEQYRHQDGKTYFEKYNSRPRDMINLVLQKYQNGNGDLRVLRTDIPLMIEVLYLLKTKLSNSEIIEAVEQQNELSKTMEYTIDALMPFFRKINKKNIEGIITELYENEEFLSTFEKSLSTTSNVNTRVGVVHETLEKY